MRWERLPLPVPLVVGHERVVFLDEDVRVGLPAALAGKLRVQSTGGTLYLLAAETIARPGCSCNRWRRGRSSYWISRQAPVSTP